MMTAARVTKVMMTMKRKQRTRLMIRRGQPLSLRGQMPHPRLRSSTKMSSRTRGGRRLGRIEMLSMRPESPS